LNRKVFKETQFQVTNRNNNVISCELVTINTAVQHLTDEILTCISVTGRRYEDGIISVAHYYKSSSCNLILQRSKNISHVSYEVSSRVLFVRLSNVGLSNFSLSPEKSITSSPSIFLREYSISNFDDTEKFQK
jgi:hypothetical protein